jgi:glycosyltransferase involved in cell wall biosynthesis
LPARIAFCITDFDDGGAERHLAELVTRLPRDRFEPAIVVLSRPPRAPADQLQQLVSDHRIPITFLNGRGVWSTPNVVWQLRQWLREFQPDLLQCFLAHANILGTLTAHQSGVDLIVTGIQVAEYRRHWHLALQRVAARFVDKHVCVSRSVADFAAKKMRLPRDTLAVIPNGIEMRRFVDAAPMQRGRFGLSANRRMILFAGRLDPQKRPDWLIEQMPTVFGRLPNHDLVIAGEGPMRNALGQLAARLGVADRIHFIGWQSDMPGLLAAADLVVLTSRWEGMPNVVLEAMASARPVVTTDVQGVRELLGDSASEQITPADAAAAFVEAVSRICSDPLLAERLGRQNRERASESFSAIAMVNAYCELYASLLGSEIAKAN